MAPTEMTSSSNAAQSLSADINKATKSLHTQLNRYITSRLPLCLPPHAASPATYTTGLEYFAHVFLTFESLFQDLTTQSSVNNPALSALLEDPWVHVPYNVKESSASPSPATTPTSEHDAEVQAFLASLLPRGMPRSRRLLADIARLRNQRPANLSASLARFPGEKIHEFSSHIRREVAGKPHILVAYAWCFYMAVFSGGRWIRGQLMAAGNDFWQAAQETTGSDTKLSEEGLSFFNFEGTEDGEDIKTEFKARLAAGENLLSMKERYEVVEEAKNIFRYCNSMVEELDVLMGTQESSLKVTAQEGTSAKLPLPSPSITEKPAAVATLARNESWSSSQALAAAALVVGCASWYALYYLGTP